MFRSNGCLSRFARRRRSITAAALALAALVGLVSAGGDEPSAEALPAPLSWPAGRVIATVSPAEKGIHEALERPIDLDFHDAPLNDVVGVLRGRAKIPIEIDVEALAADGKVVNLPFTFTVVRRPLRKALRAMFQPEQLAIVVKDDALIVTTRTAASQPENLSIRVYQVHDLVIAPNDPSAAAPDFDSLIDILTSTISPHDWQDNGGTTGFVRGFDAGGILALVISADDDMPYGVEQLLRNLRSAREPALARAQADVPLTRIDWVPLPEPTAGQWGQAVVRTIPPPLPQAAPPLEMPPPRVFDDASDEERRIREVLEQPYDLGTVETTLDDVAAVIGRRYAIPVRIDTPALAADGKFDDVPIVLRGRDGTLRSALRRAFGPLQLDYLVRDDELLITTKTFASRPDNLLLRTYQVHDLVIRPNDRTGNDPDFDSLIDVLTSVVRPQDWSDNGGTISFMRPFHGPGVYALIVTHNELGQRDVEQVLTMLRAARVPEVLAAQSRQPPTKRGMGVDGHTVGGGLGGAF